MNDQLSPDGNELIERMLIALSIDSLSTLTNCSLLIELKGPAFRTRQPLFLRRVTAVNFLTGGFFIFPKVTYMPSPGERPFSAGLLNFPSGTFLRADAFFFDEKLHFWKATIEAVDFQNEKLVHKLGELGPSDLAVRIIPHRI